MAGEHPVGEWASILPGGITRVGDTQAGDMAPVSVTYPEVILTGIGIQIVRLM
jgi:hypothetical protein